MDPSTLVEGLNQNKIKFEGVAFILKTIIKLKNKNKLADFGD